uniref:SUEL-type lectin domain-containing protein n=1 Tax=Onchocerca flexuosa TaxID=387005 RepID=A0A183HI71_9BILA
LVDLFRNATVDRGPPICQILASISSDLRCVKKNGQNRCSVNALEVIGPLESETNHMYTQFACPYINAVASSASSTFSTTTPAGEYNLI